MASFRNYLISQDSNTLDEFNQFIVHTSNTDSHTFQQITSENARIYSISRETSYQHYNASIPIQPEPTHIEEMQEMLLATPPHEKFDDFLDEIFPLNEMNNSTTPGIIPGATNYTHNFSLEDFHMMADSAPLQVPNSLDDVLQMLADPNFNAIFGDAPSMTGNLTADYQAAYPSPGSLPATPARRSMLKCPVKGCQNTMDFRTRSDLRHHTRTHDHKWCNICQKFLSGMAYNRHMKSKHGEDEWHCRVPGCEYTCKRDDNLRAHIRRIHGDGALRKEAVKKAPTGAVLASKRLDRKPSRRES